jgi:hypothetical protein
MSVHFIVDVWSHLVTRNGPCAKSLSFSVLDCICLQNFFTYGQIFWFQSIDQLKFIRFRSKRLRRIFGTVVCGHCASRIAWRVDCCGLRLEASRTRTTVAPDREYRLRLLHLPMHPFCSNVLYQVYMDICVGGSVWNVCEIHVAQLLLPRWPFSKLVASSGSGPRQQSNEEMALLNTSLNANYVINQNTGS